MLAIERRRGESIFIDCPSGSLTMTVRSFSHQMGECIIAIDTLIEGIPSSILLRMGADQTIHGPDGALSVGLAAVRANKVRIAFDAPNEYSIQRQELLAT